MKRQLMEIVRKDAEFFAENNILDYSLLIGIHNKGIHSPTGGSRVNSMESDSKSPHTSRQTVPNMYTGAEIQSQNSFSHIPFHEKHQGGILSTDNNQIYFFGIIDILTDYK